MRVFTIVSLASVVSGLLGVSQFATARTWTDVTGKYSIEAELFAFDHKQVILERDSDKELGAVDIEQLSEADREYLKTKEAEAQGKENLSTPQAWTTRGGMKILGRVLDYTSREVTIQRRRGKILVNDRAFDNLPEVYQQIVPRLVGHYEKNEVHDLRTLQAWLVHRGGAPVKYQVDGVVLELENGDEYAVPFFLLSDKDLEVLQPGWQRWLASDDHAAQQSHAFHLESSAAAYHRDREARRQIAQMRLNLQAIDAGITSMWEVTLYPPRGSHGSPLWVAAMGRNSAQATQNALANHPGYVAGPVRRVSR